MEVDLDYGRMNKPAKLNDLVGHVFMMKEDKGYGPYILARVEPDVYRLISLENGNRFSDYNLTSAEMLEWTDVTDLIKVSVR